MTPAPPLFRAEALASQRQRQLGEPLGAASAANEPTLQLSWRCKTPVVLQTETAECGLACLAMVAAHHGHVSDLATLRRRHSVSLKGMTLLQLAQTADRLALSARALKLELPMLRQLQLPAVLHWDFDHFVVLAAWRGERAVIHDPARGQRLLALPQLSQHFTGVALELTPAPQFKPRRDKQRLGLADLLGPLPGLPSALARILALTLALELFALASPLFVQLVVDEALADPNRRLLAILAAGFFVLALLHAGVGMLRGWLMTVLTSRLDVTLAMRLMRQLLALPMPFFERRHLGDIVSRFESVGAVQHTLASGFLEVLIDGAMALLTLALLGWISPRLALVVLVVAVLYAALRGVLYQPLRRAAEEQIVREAQQQSNFLETVRGVQSVKLFNRQSQRGALFHNLLVDQVNAGLRVQRLLLVHRALGGVLFAAGNVAVIGLGALAVLDGALSVGLLLAVIAYKQQFTARIAALIDKGVELRMLGLHVERIADVALAAPERDSAAGAACRGPGAIELKGVGYRYSDCDAPVLQDLNLRIEAGESVAITGPSGCGKTTLAKILLGLLEPTEGEVLIDGVNLRKLALSAHRERVGAVMQDDPLFAGSIADNIGFFDPTPDAQRIEQCARLAAVHDDIIAMAMGYDTLVGDMGSVLSGGQKQRVLLARALYRQPQLLVLDEATSHLDVTRERQVNDAIGQLRLTRVIIAHRPETIASCDRVVALA